MSNKLQKHLLETLNYFHNFCEDHNLEYFLIGGTLLGAVRHKGFIPWDDDIDVVMPRRDYDKLKLLANKIELPYVYKDYSTDKNYIYPFAKITQSDLLFEEIYYKPFQSGVWIDVFPLDYTFDNIVFRKIHFTLMDVVRKSLILKYGSFKLNKRSSLVTNTSKLLHPLFEKLPRKTFNFLFESLEDIPNTYFKQHHNLANLYGAWGILEVAPKDLFDEKELYEFEGYKFWGIKNADYWLQKVYGDYMELPPEHKRRSEHIGHLIGLNHPDIN